MKLSSETFEGRYTLLQKLSHVSNVQLVLIRKSIYESLKCPSSEHILPMVDRLSMLDFDFLVN